MEESSDRAFLLSSKHLYFGRKSAALVIGESDALSAELFAIDLVFGLQRINHGLVFTQH